MQGDGDANANVSANADDHAVVDGDTDADVAADAVRDDDAVAERDDDAHEASSVDGVDTNHVMNLTFVLTLVFGVPTVVVLSLLVPLDGWNEILMFVVRVGAAIWFLTAIGLYVREWMAIRA